VAGAGGANRQLTSVAPLDFGAAGTITLAARRVGGTGATISAVIRMRERW